MPANRRQGDVDRAKLVPKRSLTSRPGRRRPRSSAQLSRVELLANLAAANADRDPRRLRLKYHAMRKNAFTFLRGTCHLFYDRLPAARVLSEAPVTWISGDLHLENFGAYKGDNRLAYFDINDFDNACLAPCTFELLRMLSSILVAGPLLGGTEKDRLKLCRSYLETYTTEIKSGKPRWLERPLAQGLTKDLLRSLKHTQRVEFLDTRTKRKHKKRKLRRDADHALATVGEERNQVRKYLRRFALKQSRLGFYKVLDVVDRIAGVGSLGTQRISVLVEGRGSPDGNFVLDLKEARPSATAPYSGVKQPHWDDEAQRVVASQFVMQAISPALLSSITLGGRSFVLKELQPNEDRVDLQKHNGKRAKLDVVIRSMGEITAWSQMRAAGWQASANRDELAAFVTKRGWEGRLLELAQRRARLMEHYWREYCAACASGQFAL